MRVRHRPLGADLRRFGLLGSRSIGRSRAVRPARRRPRRPGQARGRNRHQRNRAVGSGDGDQVLPVRLRCVTPRALSARSSLRRQSTNVGGDRGLPQGSDRGSTSAMVELGVLLATGSDIAKDQGQARTLFERAAQAGNSRGALNLVALAAMDGAPLDEVRTRALLSRAAETNSAEAQYQLGLMIAEGIGGPKDDAGARGLFEKAAAQDHAGALERMGAFAQSGRGGPQNATAAKAYYERAAVLGNEEAKAALKRMECPYVVKDKRGNFVTNLCF